MGPSSKFFLAAFVAMVLALPAQAQIEKREGAERPELIPHGLFLQPRQMSVDLSLYDDIDPGHIVPTLPLQQALQYYDLNKSKIKNPNFITIVDYAIKSSKQRMWVIDMKTGVATSYWVAHGRYSDIDNDGYATVFSNVSGSGMSSLGFALTGSLYKGSHGTSMYLHGLDSTNSNIYDRAIVMHGASYVYNGYAGRSLGCPAIDLKYINALLPKLAGGSLMYMYYNQK